MFEAKGVLRVGTFLFFKFTQDHVNRAFLLLCLALQVAWSMGTTTKPMAWFKLDSDLHYCLDALHVGICSLWTQTFISRLRGM